MIAIKSPDDDVLQFGCILCAAINTKQTIGVKLVVVAQEMELSVLDMNLMAKYAIMVCCGFGGQDSY